MNLTVELPIVVTHEYWENLEPGEDKNCKHCGYEYYRSFGKVNVFYEGYYESCEDMDDGKDSFFVCHSCCDAFNITHCKIFAADFYPNFGPAQCVSCDQYEKEEKEMFIISCKSFQYLWMMTKSIGNFIMDWDPVSVSKEIIELPRDLANIVANYLYLGHENSGQRRSEFTAHIFPRESVCCLVIVQCGNVWERWKYENLDKKMLDKLPSKFNVEIYNE